MGVTPDQEPDVDQEPCQMCGGLYTAHSKDGMGECPDCADKPFKPGQFDELAYQRDHSRRRRRRDT